MVSASWALWQITWAHCYSVFSTRVSRWKNILQTPDDSKSPTKCHVYFSCLSLLVITYVTWTWHEQDGFEIDMTTHKGRETTLLTEQMLECFWIFFVHPWNFRMAKYVVNKCILVEGKITPHSLIPTSHEAQIHFFHFFELFAKELTQRLLGLGADFTQACLVGFGEKNGLLAKGWWKMMCFSFGGWVGQNWMGIGQKYPEITLSTLDLFLKRDVCIIYIYIYTLMYHLISIISTWWYHTGPNVQLKTEDRRLTCEAADLVWAIRTESEGQEHWDGGRVVRIAQDFIRFRGWDVKVWSQKVWDLFVLGVKIWKKD